MFQIFIYFYLIDYQIWVLFHIYNRFNLYIFVVLKHQYVPNNWFHLIKEGGERFDLKKITLNWSSWFLSSQVRHMNNEVLLA